VGTRGLEFAGILMGDAGQVARATQIFGGSGPTRERMRRGRKGINALLRWFSSTGEVPEQSAAFAVLTNEMLATRLQRGWVAGALTEV